eukprot:gnl/TRDRNA2_/TRDRNA2_173004_c1_seq3.p1 gnl/TRDRNA2_/TRDRNA2_173004_c1~~gnl/TRDRNA2_/TRDRNA2_173004_c1_seq3.p1  ORF type:complete len:280 (+),score=68.77 gnl/TRDRNA2_/TRDRNA2_173004_c1_seq3:30-869(+)
MCMQRLALLIWIFAIACVHCSDDDDDDGDQLIEEDDDDSDQWGEDDDEYQPPSTFSEDQMRGLFEKFDKDAKGKISLKGWLDYASDTDLAVSENALTEIFSKHDQPEDAKLTFEEVMEEMRMLGEDLHDEETLKLVDKDKDNLLDRQEIRQLLRFEHQVEIPSDGAEKVLIALDKNGDGVLSFDEFRVEFPRLRSEDQIRVFEKADADKSGTLNVQEVAFGLSREFDIEDVLSHMFEIADKDADGYVTIGEWIAAGEDIKERRPDGYDGLHQWVEHHEL